MTSLNVPEKFYQVCRLCLTVVSDTNALPELSLFGYKYQPQQRQQQRPQHHHDNNTVTSNVIAKNVNQKASSDVKGAKEVKGVKLNATNKRSSNRKSINCADESNANNGDNAHANSQHEIIGLADENDEHDDYGSGDDDGDTDEVCNNNNIDNSDCSIIDEKQQQHSSNDTAASECDSSNDDSQHEILEQIQTFLKISVSFAFGILFLSLLFLLLALFRFLFIELAMILNVFCMNKCRMFSNLSAYRVVD